MQRLKQERAELGAKWKRAREQAHITIEEAAEAAEVQPLAILAWEKGRAAPCAAQLRRLVRLYGMSAHTALFGEPLFRFSVLDTRELREAIQTLSPGLRTKVKIALAITVEADPAKV